MVKLSKRLLKIAEMVPKDATVADIGCDHAYLAIYLVLTGKTNKAIVTDIRKKPLLKAKENIEKFNLTKIIFPRLGDGLEAIQKEDKIDTLIISGMGGKLILKILNEGKDKLSPTLILQANNSVRDLRLWCQNNNYKIVDEAIVYEKGHYYEIIFAKRGHKLLTEKEILFGPILLKRKESLFIEKYKKELDLKRKILKNIKDEDSIQYKNIEKEIKILESILE
ncbi:MAG TPA: SAM-dependent methyltransferase [Tenericutes bacterium]|nr:SAM-dependent methyltransferase [Mycoplasmatota bacterium]